jgi:hypothetical protein
MTTQTEFDFGPEDYSSLGPDYIAAAAISPLTTLDISSLTTMNSNSTYNLSVGTNTFPSSWNMNTGGTVYNTGTVGSIGLNPIWTTGTTPPPPNLVVDGDIKWNGRSLGTLLENIEDRLAILQEPTPERLERFTALREAYDAYKMLDTLCGDDKKDTK